MRKLKNWKVTGTKKSGIASDPEVKVQFFDGLSEEQIKNKVKELTETAEGAYEFSYKENGV